MAQTRRVSELFSEIGPHGLESQRVQRGRRIVIKIDGSFRCLHLDFIQKSKVNANPAKTYRIIESKVTQL